MQPDLSSKSAYKYKLLSGGIEHAEKLEHGFVTAYQKGYSVVEIARVAGSKSAKYIHAVLVKHGQIIGAKRGRQSKKIVLPEGFAAQLEIRELSFAQWASGWAFEQEEVIRGLDERKGQIIEAIKRDFPHYYSKLTGSAVDDFASGPEFERQNFTVVFDYDGSEGCYKAELPDLGIVTYGGSYQYALHLALIRRRDQVTLSRLEGLPVLSRLGGSSIDW